MTRDLSMFELGHLSMIRMLQERILPEHRAAVEDMSLAVLSSTLRTMLKEELFAIPAGAMAVPCRWCGAQVYWVKARADKRYRESVSISGPDCVAPTATTRGRGFAHVADCPHSGLRHRPVIS
jgi:hypothetical protein